jgi:arylsulfatase
MNAPNQFPEHRGWLVFTTASLFFLLAATPVNAQQIYGAPGSPEATQSINGQVLPAPALQFGGVINLNAKQSKPWWPPRIVPPKGVPNILLIMTDDVGFGAPSTFGGVIPTPTLDRIAAASG